MGIFASVEDENGDTLGEVLELLEIWKRFPSGPEAAGHCLRFIGDDVDASFNARQLKYLREELEALRVAGLPDVAEAELALVLRLVRKAGEERRRNLRFYGEF